MSRPAAGSIVLVDWRLGALANEATKIRPAVVVEDSELFPDSYPNVLVAPLTRNESLAYPAFSERVEPTTENGASSTSWALAHHVTSVALRRVEPTSSRITREQLESLRRRIALALEL